MRKKFHKKISMMLVMMLIANIWIGMPSSTFAATGEAWLEIGPRSKEGTQVFASGGQYILIQKDDKKSTVYTGNENGWGAALSGISEIDSAWQTTTGSVYVVGSKQGLSFYESSDQGDSWTNLLEQGSTLPSQISGTKTEAIYVEDSEIYLMAGDKKGIYYSADGGASWGTKNNSIPTSYEARGMWKYDGKYYVATKKQGVLISEDGDSFTQLKGGNGLSSSGKEVFEVFAEDNKVWAATKDGVYTTDLQDNSQGFIKLEGLSDEVKNIIEANGTLYVTGKDANNIYTIDKTGTLQPFTNKPDGITVDDMKDMAYDGQNLIVSHKKGVLKIQIPDREEETGEQPEEDGLQLSQLDALIALAQAKYEGAVEGSGAGEYEEGVKDELLSAISRAETIRDEAQAQEEIDGAYQALNAAIMLFESHRHSMAWQEIGPDTKDGTHIFVFEKGQYLLIRKSDDNSIVSTTSPHLGNALWTDTLTNIKEVDAAYQEGDTVYIVGNKKGQFFYKSEDAGNNWTNLLEGEVTLPSGISNIKIEGLFVEGSEIYLLLGDKKGIYYSADAGMTWSTKNNSLLTSYEARGMWKYNGKYYIVTKKQGIFISEDGEVFTQVKSGNGLTSEKSKEIFEIAVDGNMLWAATKEGLYKTDLYQESQGFTKVEGLTDEVKNILSVNGRIYVTGKSNANIYYVDSTGVLRPFTNQPEGLKIEELKDIKYDNGQIIAAHKKGVFLIQEEYIIWTADAVAEGITSVKAPGINKTQLEMPEVPNGYKAELYESNREDVIALNGTITPPDVETTVKLIFKITNKTDSTDTALTKEIEVIVPRKQEGVDIIVYQGTGKGRNEGIVIEITVNGGQIISAEIVSHNESVSGYDHSDKVAEALRIVPENIIKKQALDVDTVSGATETSRGVLRAAINALEGTKFVQDLADANWKELIADGNEGVFVTVVNNKYLYVNKNGEKTSTVRIVDANGKSEVKLQNIAVIESGYRVEGTQTIYLIGRKDGNNILVTHDGGETWSEPLVHQGLPSEKVESLLVLSENEMIAIVNKYGLYRSTDGGKNWTVYNNNLPVNPEKESEYDARKIYSIEGKWYLSTKKQGILTSVDGVTWVPFKSAGLTKEGKDVWDIYHTQDTLYVTGKDGLWKTTLSDQSSWVQVAGFDGEGRKIMAVEDRLYVISKNMQVYYMNEGSLKIMSTLPANMIAEDPKSIEYDKDSFILSHKKGLIKLKDSLIKEEEPVDTGSGATSSGDWSTPVLVIPEEGTLKLESYITKDASGKTTLKITAEHLAALLKENSKLKEIKVLMPEDITNFEIKLENETYKAMKSNKSPLIIAYSGGEYKIPYQLKALEELSKDKGEMLNLGLHIEQIEATKEMKENYKLLATPVEYTLEAEFKNGKVILSDFGKQYIERSIVIDDILDFKTSVGAVFEGGSFKPVPTTFRIEDNKTIAVIKRNSNSLYSIIENKKDFNDIKNHWGKNVIELLASKMILKGTGDAFEPEASLTRAQFTCMLVRGLGLKTVSQNEAVFSDIVSGSWYEKDVYTAYASGIVSGIGKDTFGPNNLITREEMVVMATRAIDIVQESQIETTSEEQIVDRWKDGTYEGSAPGFYGTPLRVKVTISAGKIKKIDLTEMHETAHLGDIAVDETMKRIIKAQSEEVDMITGATISGEAAMKAVKNALADAKPDTSEEEGDTEFDYVPFIDEKEMSSWAVKSIEYAAKVQIVKGTADGSFKPKATSKRGEAAAILKNVLDRLEFISE